MALVLEPSPPTSRLIEHVALVGVGNSLTERRTVSREHVALRIVSVLPPAAVDLAATSAPRLLPKEAAEEDGEPPALSPAALQRIRAHTATIRRPQPPPPVSAVPGKSAAHRCVQIGACGEAMAEHLGGWREDGRRRYELASATRRRWYSGRAAPVPPTPRARTAHSGAAVSLGGHGDGVGSARLVQLGLRTHDATTLATDRTVHVWGLRGTTEDERKIAALFEPFGRVRGCTLQPRPPATEDEDEYKKFQRMQPTWALVSFNSPTAAHLALRSSPTLRAAGLVVRPVEMFRTKLVVRGTVAAAAAAAARQKEPGHLDAEEERNHVEVIELDILKHQRTKFATSGAMKLAESLEDAARPMGRSAASFLPLEERTAREQPQLPAAQPVISAPTRIAALISPRGDAAQLARREAVWRRINDAVSAQ